MMSARRQTLPQTAIAFWVGRDAEGFWTARGADGREGGLFVSRAEAMKFAKAARRRGPGAAKRAPSPVDLWQKGWRIRRARPKVATAFSPVQDKFISFRFRTSSFPVITLGLS